MIKSKLIQKKEMYRSFITRMVSIGLTFGLFFMISCSAMEQSSSRSSTSVITQLDNKLADVNNRIAEDPEDESLLREKADLLFQLAEQLENPAQKRDLFSEITLLSSGQPFMEEPLLSELNERRREVWSREQSHAIRLHQQNKSEETSRDYPRITAHFENAIAILPDSLVTYTLLATTHYEQGYVLRAAQILNDAIDRSDKVKPEITEKLAWILLETGESEASIQLYEQLVRDHPRNSHYLHGLVNAYVIGGYHSRAVERLSLLIEEFPTRLYYLETLFEQYFFLTESKVNTLIRESDVDSDERATIDEILASAEGMQNLFGTIKERIPMGEELNFKTGVYFHHLSDLMESLSESDLVPSSHTEKLIEVSNSALEQALELIESAATMNPENMEYNYRLHEIYLRLGMLDEADQIEQRLNL